MELQKALKILHEDYLKNPPDKRDEIGCFDRAHILFCIMKDNELDVKRLVFFFKNKEGKRIKPSSHCVVISNEKVYDSNKAPNDNPTPIDEYKSSFKIDKGNSLEIEEWDKSEMKEEYRKKYILDYLKENFENEFQQDVKPLVMQYYDT